MKPAALKLPGAHRVTKPLAGGRFAIYWYRCRGGGLMMKFVGDNLAQALAAEAAGATALAAVYGKPPPKGDAAGRTFLSLIKAYKTAPNGFEGLAPSTQKHWRRSLDVIQVRFEKLPLKALSAPGMTKVMVSWRNSFKETPRQADYHMTVLKRVISWGVENGEITVNPAKGIKSIHKSNRADLIVEPNELEAIVSAVSPAAARVIRLAAATAIRREDLTKLEWKHVYPDHLKFATGKSSGRKTVIVPLIPEAKAIIEDARIERDRAIAHGRLPSPYVLLTHLGTPWKPDSVTQAFVDGAKTAGVDRHLNDLRGTAITRFVLAGWNDEQVADVVGWELARVRNIRKHYVDAATVAMGLVAQLERAEA